MFTVEYIFFNYLETGDQQSTNKTRAACEQPRGGYPPVIPPEGYPPVAPAIVPPAGLPRDRQTLRPDKSKSYLKQL